MVGQFFSDLCDAWLGIRRRPFRFLLSGLGIGIGVSALIAMLSISEGARLVALSKIESLGIDSIRIEELKQIRSGTKLANLTTGLTTEDSLIVRQRLPRGSLLGEYLKKDGVEFISSRKAEGELLAVTAEWSSVEQLRIVSGRGLLPLDIDTQKKVCVVAAPLAASLGVSVGRILRVGQELYFVVGISEGKGRLLTEGTGLSAINFDQLVMIPRTTFPFFVSDREKQRLHGFTVRLPNAQKHHIREISERIENLLQQRHRGVKDFLVIAPLRLLKESRATQRVFSLVMGTIAGLSLLVGGIGVMNAMLANIKEQTREIGLRIAVGATKTRIVSFYLCQSILLTLLSGLWGILGGVVVAQVVQVYAGWDVGYSAAGLLIGPLFAVLSGVLFGLYPALKASDISPAIALRDV